MRRAVSALAAALVAVVVLATSAPAADAARLRFAVRYPRSLAAGPLDGIALVQGMSEALQPDVAATPPSTRAFTPPSGSLV